VRPGDPSRLGGFVRRQREDLGLSQAALARRLHLSVHSLGRLERGERGVPSLSELRRWAPVLDVDEAVLVELLDRDDRRGPEGFEGPDDDVVVHTRATATAFLNVLRRSARSILIWQTWLLVDMGLREALAEAAANGAALRVLLLDPACAAGVTRAEALGYRDAASYLAANLVKVVGDLGAIGVEPGRVLRLSTTMPPAPIYASEDRMLVGWYLPDGPSTVRPQVEVSAASDLADVMTGAFETEWARARPVDPADPGGPDVSRRP
jgi:transcriptional regulator with XRE-family HTH domain